jgi:hypothetical protein
VQKSEIELKTVLLERGVSFGWSAALSPYYLICVRAPRGSTTIQYVYHRRGGAGTWWVGVVISVVLQTIVSVHTTEMLSSDEADLRDFADGQNHNESDGRPWVTIVWKVTLPPQSGFDVTLE